MIRTLLFVACIGCSVKSYSQANFTDVSVGQPIFSSFSARGVSVVDFDNDGDDDFYVCSGSSDANKLFRNNGNFSFTEIGKEAGLDLRYTCQMSVWFDADNDGWLDVYIGGDSKNFFYKNNGNGTFTDITASSGLSSSYRPGALLVGDLNADGWLDIYANNFSADNQLFLNYGQFNFRNKIAGSGAESRKAAMAGVLLDQDNDGDLDIYLVYDGDQNSFFNNDGKGGFTEISDALNLTHKADGMGVDFADFNHDGKSDFYIANLFENSLFLSQTDGTYQNVAAAFNANDKGMGWGTICLDYNNDSFQDVYVVNDYSFSPYTNKLYRNDQGIAFSNVTSTALESKKNCYGAASGDFNTDGLQDIVIGNFSGGGVQLFQNNENGGNWIQLSLVGVASNKFAVGALVKCKVNGVWLQDEVTVGSGYGSQNSYTIHVGLSNKAKVDELLIRWPSGNTDRYTDVNANHRYLAIQSKTLSLFDVTSFQNALKDPNTITFGAAPSLVTTTVQFHSVARKWNEALINAIRADLARPTVHARNLFHFSAAVYDAWAAFDNSATTYFLKKSVNGFFTPFNGINKPDDINTARNEAISYAAFRLLKNRFQNSPGAATTIPDLQLLMRQLGYDESLTSTDYSTGSPAALGNYIAAKVIEFGLQDGSNESGAYANKFYQPFNQPMRPDVAGSQNMADPNRWQPLKLQAFIDQNGNVQGTTPPFLSAEWGSVSPFALEQKDLKKIVRDGNEYLVYHDPGVPPQLSQDRKESSSEYMWNFSLVSIWGSHLDQADGVAIDVSPASKGNIDEKDYPTTLNGYHTFYNLKDGGDIGKGYSINPKTGLPYQKQIVPRGDYARVLAEFWADGPKSETPPGHWFTLMNSVSDHPSLQKKWNGKGNVIDDLEWDVKSYFTLGGALHDAAITAWGIKGYYDGVRPISAIRYMADKGQSSDSNLPHYHPQGIPLQKGFVELVDVNDPLAGVNQEHVNKIKLYTWKGPNVIKNPAIDQAGVGWILAENWYPYQRPSFVTPPFAGYISGHSTYSSAGAEVLTRITGDEYFPGGLGEFTAKKNEYLVFEEGPSVDVKLQWARYKDASDQSSLSRIWGGIHPPADDMPGRFIGKTIGANAFQLANQYFTNTISGVEFLNEDVSVFPNPVARGNSLHVYHPENKLPMVEILDVFGRLLARQQLNASNEIDTSGLPVGLLMVRISSENNIRIFKVIVE